MATTTRSNDTMLDLPGALTDLLLEFVTSAVPSSLMTVATGSSHSRCSSASVDPKQIQST